MGVEGGTISAGVGAAASIGSAISGLRGGLGPGISGFVSEGPARGFSSLAGLGAKLEAPLQSFVNEGPVAPSFLENTMPIFKPIGEIKFNPAQLNTADVISQAASILSQANPKPVGAEVPAIFQTGLADIILDPAIKNPVPQLGVLNKSAVSPLPEIKQVIEPVEHIPFPVIQPAVKPAVDIFPKTELKTENTVFVQPVTQPRAENKVATQLPKVLTNSMLQEQGLEVTEQQVEEILEETQRVTESEQLVAVYTKDETAATNRLTRALEEFIKLYKEIKGKVKGTKLLERLSDELDEEKSRLLFQLGIKNKPDGSNVDGFRKRLSVMEFEGLEDGIKKITQANEEFDPVKLGKDGKLEPPEAVVKVLQNTAEPIRPVKRLINKIITRRLQQLTQQSPQVLNVTEVVDVKTEPSIEENPQLAEVFGFTALTD